MTCRAAVELYKADIILKTVNSSHFPGYIAGRCCGNVYNAAGSLSEAAFSRRHFNFKYPERKIATRDGAHNPMSEDMWQLVEEAIRLELNVAEVYLGFHHRFHEDADFWWKLAIEEKNHAALLMNGKQYFLKAEMFPRELVGGSLDALIEANRELERILRQEKEAPMSRAPAFNLAVKLEELAGEIHFQHAMQERENPPEALRLFQSLNEDDMNHASRIRNYMRKKGIDKTP